MRTTPLHARHEGLGGKLVDFAGWSMPLHYGSQIEEHHHVRRHAGVFDVSHMTVVDLTGPDSLAFLQRLITNDPARLTEVGAALYACMCNDQGGVLDDLIVYDRGPQGAYRVVVNAATREPDLAWMRQQAAGFTVEINERDDLAMLAIQGPQARALTDPLLPDALRQAAANLRRFQAVERPDHEPDWFVARTGYTGEDGYEVILPAARAGALWDALLADGVQPAGLGARDTLRLEAGMSLYGNDLDADHTPLESGLAWTVAWEPSNRVFIGRGALEAQRAGGPTRRLVGLVLEGRGVLRAHMTVHTPSGSGETTSGGFSPTLERSIGLARVPDGPETTCEVEIRGKRVPARIVQPPFVRNGQAKVAI